MEPNQQTTPNANPAGAVSAPAAGQQPVSPPAPPNQPANNSKQIAKVPQQPKKTLNSTQNTLLISELRDNFVIMNDGSMRAVISCQSINFDLMSAREREGIEFSYQNFLNSLYFPIQILIRSQKVDIGPYLEKLAKLRSNQDNLLLGVLMDDYIDFIASIAQETNIMDKSFFAVIPYYNEVDVNSTINTSKNMLISLFSSQTQNRVKIDETTFERSKDELRNRVQTVISGLMQIGIRGNQLSTKELGEVYYNIYNPDTAVRQPLASIESMTAPIITKGTGTPPLIDNNRGMI